MTRVHAGDGSLLAEYSHEQQPLSAVQRDPPLVRRAFISAEDQNFYTHPGVDPLAIARAAIFDLAALRPGQAPGWRLHDHPAGGEEHAAGQPAFAGSRKAKEAILAMRIEENLEQGPHPRTLPERD